MAGGDGVPIGQRVVFIIVLGILGVAGIGAAQVQVLEIAVSPQSISSSSLTLT